MMSKQNNALLLAVIRAAIKGEADAALDARLTEQSLKELYMSAKTYDLSHFVGYVLEMLGRTSTPIEQEYIRMYMFAVCRYERIKQDEAELGEVLREQGIAYLPLKGAVARDYYPAPWMRTSTDIDILIEDRYIDVARQLVEQRLGYEFHQVSDHDLAFYTPGGTHFELHFSLIEDGVVGKVDEPLQHIWQHTSSCEGDPCHLVLDHEMFYYYHMAHMAKHFVQGGCGIRPFLDVWLMLDRLPLDRSRCDELLMRGEILGFSRHAEHLCRVWFGDEMHTEVTEQMQAFLLAGDEFGTYENRAAVAQAKMGGKARYALSRIWLPYKQMCVFYPSLKGKKWLLPLYECWRWCKLVFGGGARRSVKELAANQSVTDEQRTDVADMLRKLGL